MGGQSRDHASPDRCEPGDASTQLAAARAKARTGKSAQPCITDVRKDLAREFEPRYHRAMERFRPTVTREWIGGLRCLVVEPQEMKSEDLILHVFGGGFVSGCPEYEMPIAAHLSAACGMKVVLPYYALAPEARYPVALHKVASVYVALAQNLSGKIVLTGESAGGGLALSLLLEVERQGLELPRALLLFSPWLDLTEDGIRQSARNDPTLSPEMLELFSGAYCDAHIRKTISPAYFDFPFSLPPTHISTGTRDIMEPQLEAFFRKCQNEGQPVKLKSWDDMWHAFELYDDLPEAQVALNEAAIFITMFGKAE